MKTLLSRAAALALLAAPAAAQESVSAETLTLYAAMSKLEANKAEAAGALLLAAMPGHSDAVYEEAREDWESDGEQLEGYIAAIREMDLADDQRAAIDAFAEGWAEAVETGTPLVENFEDSAAYRARVFDWWESLDELDDAIDDALEDLLARHGVAFDGALED